MVRIIKEARKVEFVKYVREWVFEKVENIFSLKCKEFRILTILWVLTKIILLI